MVRTTPGAEAQPRKATAESRRDNRRVTIDALFARQSSQSLPSSSPPGPPQSDSKLKLSGPRTKKAAPVVTPATRMRASLSRSHLAASPSENAQSPVHTPVSDTTSAMRTRSSCKKQDDLSPENVSAGRARLVSATNASHRAKANPSRASKPVSLGQSTEIFQESSSPKSIPRKRALPRETSQEDVLTSLYCVPTQAPSATQTPSSPQRTTRSSATKPLTPKGNVLPSPSDSDTSRKRARLSPPEAHCALRPGNLSLSSQATDSYEVVPSSQSDEHELTMSKVMKKDPAAVKEAVDQWRRGADTDISCAAPGADLPMDVDQPEGVPGSPLSSIPTGLQTPTSEPELQASSPPPYTLSSPTSCHTTLAASLSMAASSPSSPARATPAPLLSMGHRPITPPSDGRGLSVPSTPVTLNEESKTAQIIAEIKARAYATVPSSPDNIPVELKELGYADSSSDESEKDFTAAFKKFDKSKGKGKAGPSTPLPVVKKTATFGSPISRSGKSSQNSSNALRYGLRPKTRTAEYGTGNRRMPTLVGFRDTRGKQSRKADPLDALLKEKQRADKRGGGEDALRAAEAAIVSSSKINQEAKAKAKASLKREMDEEDSSDVDPAWADERAAMDVVKKGSRRFKSRSSSPLRGSEWDEDSEDGSDGELDAVRQQALRKLGKEGGQKVGHILVGNRLLREAMSKVILRDRILGVPFWDDSPPGEADTMVIDSLPALSFDEADVQAYPLLGLLQNTVREEDASRLSILLHSGALSTLQPMHAAVLLRWLFVAATDPGDQPYTESAYHSLQQLAHSASQAGPQPGLYTPLVADALLRLGAKSNACGEFGEASALGWKPAVGIEKRDPSVYRAVSSLTVLAREGVLPHEDMPAIVLFLILIALDRTTSPDLGRDIMVAVEAIGQAIALSDEGVQTETAIYSRLVKFAHTQAPMNQAYMLSFISGSCVQTNRIARNVARALLLKEEKYDLSPSLAPIVDLLSPPAGSGGIFDIQGNADKGDYYEDLSCYVDILSKALSDIPGYTALEKEATAGHALMPSQGEESLRKGAAGEREPTHLEQIKMLLDSLHGKIVDTRAAFLDRSRAKAALQRLSLRVHYQRRANLHSGPGTGKPRNIRNYFAQPKNGV
ncbi:hypothetical protein DAEQUDRAFT_809331 [Daedalea quercina L-15889]|uniref:Uncharacterized protein n=1 Tax=Daedalea quercina L-15889 TaxID=1314783 RepID=A0A165SIT1_9APHY|nr:hypothetical protein DAEQUDRAFT_809331 [Daedalea quercina L-15889]